MISESSWTAWKVFRIIYAQAFTSNSPKIELLFWAKCHWRCTNRYRSTGSVLQEFDLFATLQGKKRSSPIKKNCGRRNFKIEEAGRQKGRRRSKSNFWVRSLLLGWTICETPDGLRGIVFFGCWKTNETCFTISTAHACNRRPQKSLLKEFRMMKKQQELMIQMFSHMRFTFLIFSPTINATRKL